MFRDEQNSQSDLAFSIPDRLFEAGMLFEEYLTTESKNLLIKWTPKH